MAENLNEGWYKGTFMFGGADLREVQKSPSKSPKNNVEDFGPPYADLVADGNVKISSQC